MLRTTHIFGPMSGVAISLASPRTPERIWYAPCPPNVPSPFGNGYLAIAYNTPPEEPWPDQVEYVLDRERSELRPHHQYGDEGMEEGHAVYMLAASTH